MSETTLKQHLFGHCYWYWISYTHASQLYAGARCDLCIYKMRVLHARLCIFRCCFCYLFFFSCQLIKIVGYFVRDHSHRHALLNESLSRFTCIMMKCKATYAHISVITMHWPWHHWSEINVSSFWSHPSLYGQRASYVNARRFSLQSSFLFFSYTAISIALHIIIILQFYFRNASFIIHYISYIYALTISAYHSVSHSIKGENYFSMTITNI